MIHRETWRALIGPALRVVDSLKTNGYGDLGFLRATRNTRPALLTRLAAMESVPQPELVADIAFTDQGRPFAETMVGRLRQSIAELDDG